MRITHPVRALVVVNCTLPVVAPVAIVSEAGIVNAELDDSSLATVGEAAGVPSETTQLPEIPGVRTVGMQDSDNGLVSVGATREMAAVNLAEAPVCVAVGEHNYDFSTQRRIGVTTSLAYTMAGTRTRNAAGEPYDSDR